MRLIKSQINLIIYTANDKAKPFGNADNQSYANTIKTQITKHKSKNKCNKSFNVFTLLATIKNINPSPIRTNQTELIDQTTYVQQLVYQIKLKSIYSRSDYMKVLCYSILLQQIFFCLQKKSRDHQMDKNQQHNKDNDEKKNQHQNINIVNQNQFKHQHQNPKAFQKGNQTYNHNSQKQHKDSLIRKSPIHEHQQQLGLQNQISRILQKYFLIIMAMLTNVQSSLFVACHNATRYMMIYMIACFIEKLIEFQNQSRKRQHTKLQLDYLKKIKNFKQKAIYKLLQYEKDLQMVQNNKMVAVKAKSTMQFIKRLNDDPKHTEIQDVASQIIKFVQQHLFTVKNLKFKQLQIKYAIHCQNKLQQLNKSEVQFQRQQIKNFVVEAIQINFYIVLIEFYHISTDNVSYQKNSFTICQKIQEIFNISIEEQNKNTILKTQLNCAQQIQNLSNQILAGIKEVKEKPLSIKTYYGLQFNSELKKTVKESLTARYLKKDWEEAVKVNQKKA